MKLLRRILNKEPVNKEMLTELIDVKILVDDKLAPEELE